MSAENELKEIFEKMPEAFVPEKASGVQAIILLELSGEGGGSWVLKIADQKIDIDEGPIETADLTLAMTTNDYVALSRGEANPMSLFMAGKVKLQGDVGLALKFSEMFDREQVL